MGVRLNENTNGLIRDFFPKGTDFSTISNAEVTRSNVYSTRDLENPSASVHRKRFLTPSLALKFLCTGDLNPRYLKSPFLLDLGTSVYMITKYCPVNDFFDQLSNRPSHWFRQRFPAHSFESHEQMFQCGVCFQAAICFEL